MSFQAMAWATDLSLPTREKFVLLMLANYASSDKWDCYPSVNTLARNTGMSRDTVIRAIKTLEKDGFVEVIRRMSDGINLPNVYRLIKSAGGSSCVQGVVAECDYGSSTQQGGVVAGCDSNQSFEPVIEPSSKQQAVRVPYEQIFDAYAEHLPSLPQLKLKDDARRTLIKRLWHSDKRFQTVEFWQKYFAYVSDSHFLMNDCKAIGFDWLLKPANFKKVLEGNYHAAK